MKLLLKKSYFSLLILFFTPLAIGFIYRLYSAQIFVNEPHTEMFGNILLTGFAVLSLIIFLTEIITHRKILQPLFSVDTFVFISLTLLLVLSVFKKEVGIYATGFFVLFA